ncbi:MAG: aldo/keto reductase [Clostridia bacterium]|nr:aldo/keto reductase [Clostridia bacterium]
MYQKKFNGIPISALGMGCLRFPTEPGQPNRIDRAEAQKVIDAAVESGINYFDTAFIYQNGDSERFVGEALQKYPRKRYYLATKFYATPSADIEAVFAEQLRRCRTDYFDFYLLHGMDEACIAAHTDPQKDYLGFFLKQKAAGRIRYIGFSSHAAPDTLQKFLDWHDGFDMALIQLNYLDWTLLNAKRQYEILTERGIPVWVMEPLKGGRLSTLNDKACALLQAAAPDRSVSSWGFRFLMGLPNVQTVLSGMSSVQQVLDNAKTFEAPDPLSAAESETLRRAAAIFMEDLGVPCSACRYCCDTCPAGLDIPLLIKGYNERSVSGETWRIATLSNAKGAEHCLQCGICAKHCPQKIDIPAVMRKLAPKPGAQAE